MNNSLKPCPFCGGPPELDTTRRYIAIATGRMGNEVAIYCIECSADMSLCHEDVPDMSIDDMVFALTDAWNKRDAPADPRLDDLATLVRRLARSLDKPCGDTLLARQALDYLRRKGLQGSPLRDTDTKE